MEIAKREKLALNVLLFKAGVWLEKFFGEKKKMPLLKYEIFHRDKIFLKNIANLLTPLSPEVGVVVKKRKGKEGLVVEIQTESCSQDLKSRVNTALQEYFCGKGIFCKSLPV